MNLLEYLAKLLKKFPIKTIFIVCLTILLLVVGARSIYMATGNDTLVKTSTDVYKNNEMLEEEFGGESIIVLYESDDLLTPEHLKHMKGIENALATNSSIFSMMSPVTLVEEMAEKQSDKFQDGIDEIIDGLDEMGGKLTDIGGELEINAKSESDMEFPEMEDLELPGMEGLELPGMGTLELPAMDDAVLPEFDGFPDIGEIQLPELELPEFADIEAPDMDEQMKELDQMFSNLIEAQEMLEEGTEGLVNGYEAFGGQLETVGESLLLMTDHMPDNLQKDQLVEISQKLLGLAEQMSHISDESKQLPEIPDHTAKALKIIQKKLALQIDEQMEMVEKQQEKQEQMKKEMQKQEVEKEKIEQEMQDQQEEQKEKMKEKIQSEQESEQEEMQKEMIAQQEAQKVTMQQEMQSQKKAQKDAIQAKMEEQQAEKEAEMQKFKTEMEEQQEKQAGMLSDLGDGLTTMGENLQDISENMETIERYSDIMTPGLPEKQATLDNIVYEDDGELRTMFEEVVVDDDHMMMMIQFKGGTGDDEKSEVVDIIRNYLNDEKLDSLETIVSGKPVLDSGIRSSMQESIQQMMGLALLLMVVVLFFVFKVRWFLLPLLTVLIAVIGTIGLMGWLQIPITMVSMAVFPILIGLGIDYAIQFQNRYAEEMVEENSE